MFITNISCRFLFGFVASLVRNACHPGHCIPRPFRGYSQKLPDLLCLTELLPLTHSLNDAFEIRGISLANDCCNKQPLLLFINLFMGVLSSSTASCLRA
ncbi:MAG: hypothetical protein CMJ40_06415 [Phycisphaerae bacterium]|nr:hypothetical protein [Phycisphaerae bacterium]